MPPSLKEPARICAAAILAAVVVFAAQAEKFLRDFRDFCDITLPQVEQTVQDSCAALGLESLNAWGHDALDSAAAWLESPSLSRGDAAEDAQDIRVALQNMAIFGGGLAERAGHAAGTFAGASAKALQRVGGTALATLRDMKAQEDEKARILRDKMYPQEFGPLFMDPLGEEDAEKELASCPVRCKIIMAGDSQMESFAPALHKHLLHRNGLEFVMTARYSTGLCRPDYFNWPENFRQIVEETHPDIAVFFIGANDAMPIKLAKGSVYAGQPGWKEAYSAKVEEMLAICSAHHMQVLWIGLPVMGGKYATLLHQTCMAARETVESHGLRFLDTEPLLADENGEFCFYGTGVDNTKVRLRTNDKCHVTSDGNQVIIRSCLPILEEMIAKYKLAHPERCTDEALESQARSAPLKFILKFKPKK